MDTREEFGKRAYALASKIPIYNAVYDERGGLIIVVKREEGHEAWGSTEEEQEFIPTGVQRILHLTLDSMLSEKVQGRSLVQRRTCDPGQYLIDWIDWAHPDGIRTYEIRKWGGLHYGYVRHAFNPGNDDIASLAFHALDTGDLPPGNPLMMLSLDRLNLLSRRLVPNDARPIYK